MAIPNWYNTLGVPEDITKPDLERLREEERLEHHPDRHSTASQAEKDRHAARLKTVLDGVSLLLTKKGRELLDEQLRGEPDEEPSYTTLPPSVAIGWLAVTKSRKKWQWVELFEGSSGTEMYKLTASGETLSDATITYDPKSGVAQWHIGSETFTYPAKQRDIAPAEVEVYVKKYLH